MKQPKEKSRRRETNSLSALDFGQHKKYSDFSSNDKKDDCNIKNNFGSERFYLKGNYDDRVVRIADPKGPSDPFEKEVHEEEYSSKQKEIDVVELSAWNQEVLTVKLVDIEELGVGVFQQDSDLKGFEEPFDVNLSMVIQDEKSLDKKIRVDHIVQGQEADDPVDMQAINQV